MFSKHRSDVASQTGNAQFFRGFCFFCGQGSPAPWPRRGDRGLLEVPSDLSPGQHHPLTWWNRWKPVASMPRLVFGLTIKPWMGKVLQVFGIFVVAVLTRDAMKNYRWTCGRLDREPKKSQDGMLSIPVHQSSGPVWRLTILAHLPPTGAAAPGLNLRTSQGRNSPGCENSVQCLAIPVNTSSIWLHQACKGNT